MIGALRRSRRLQPLHRRYGPIKYKYVLPAYQRLGAWLRLRPVSDSDPKAHAQLNGHYEHLRYDRNRAIERIKQFAYTPIISVILPVYNPRPYQLQKAIESVLSQHYFYWELCVCDDASTEPRIREMLEEYRARDARIKLEFSESNAGIARASNRALEMATGEFIGLLDHDDELTPDALYEVAATVQETDADLIYSDEDRLDQKGRRAEPVFKPAWSPDLLLSCMYIGHFCAYRKSIVERIGGFRPGFDGSQDYDLALRFTEATSKIAHIPKILYHWRRVSSSASARSVARPGVTEAGRRTLIEALSRRQIDGEVETENVYGFYRVRRKLNCKKLVSIIIPTRDGEKRLRRCISSIEAKTDYRNHEILIVDNGSRNTGTLDYLKRLPYRVIRLDEPFNFSHLNNVAAGETTGEYLLFLNDDTEVINAQWMTSMVEQAQREEVGAVGAKLLYANGRIQHAGIILAAGGPSHAHRGVDGFSGAGYLNYPNAIRNYSAVTAACLMIRRDVFLSAGGFDADRFAVSYNDVDLCLRLRRQGYLIVYTPYALLYHYESATRGANHYPREEASLRARWHSELMSDRYYNPNLSALGDFSVDGSNPESLAGLLHFR
jgi:GT2 family glycosyltransferase